MPAISERYCSTENWKGMNPEQLKQYDMSINYLIDDALFNKECSDYKTFTQAWRDDLLNIIFTMLRAGGTLN